MRILARGGERQKQKRKRREETQKEGGRLGRHRQQTAAVRRFSSHASCLFLSFFLPSSFSWTRTCAAAPRRNPSRAGAPCWIPCLAVGETERTSQKRNPRERKASLSLSLSCLSMERRNRAERREQKNSNLDPDSLSLSLSLPLSLSPPLSFILTQNIKE